MRSFYFKRNAFHSCLAKFPNIWATFDRKFVAKMFQKSPNLVTLLTNSTANISSSLFRWKFIERLNTIFERNLKIDSVLQQSAIKAMFLK